MITLKVRIWLRCDLEGCRNVTMVDVEPTMVADGSLHVNRADIATAAALKKWTRRGDSDRCASHAEKKKVSFYLERDVVAHLEDARARALKAGGKRGEISISSLVSDALRHAYGEKP